MAVSLNSRSGTYISLLAHTKDEKTLIRAQPGNHMSCNLCGCHFCFLCGTSLPPSKPYLHFQDRTRYPKCYYKLFGKSFDYLSHSCRHASDCRFTDEGDVRNWEAGRDADQVDEGLLGDLAAMAWEDPAGEDGWDGRGGELGWR